MHNSDALIYSLALVDHRAPMLQLDPDKRPDPGVVNRSLLAPIVSQLMLRRSHPLIAPKSKNPSAHSPAAAKARRPISYR